MVIKFASILCSFLRRDCRTKVFGWRCFWS